MAAAMAAAAETAAGITAAAVETAVGTAVETAAGATTAAAEFSCKGNEKGAHLFSEMGYIKLIRLYPAFHEILPP